MQTIVAVRAGGLMKAVGNIPQLAALCQIIEYAAANLGIVMLGKPPPFCGQLGPLAILKATRCILLEILSFAILNRWHGFIEAFPLYPPSPCIWIPLGVKESCHEDCASSRRPVHQWDSQVQCVAPAGKTVG
jgi:hypothetical protein